MHGHNQNPLLDPAMLALLKEGDEKWGLVLEKNPVEVLCSQQKCVKVDLAPVPGNQTEENRYRRHIFKIHILYTRATVLGFFLLCVVFQLTFDCSCKRSALV